jgi:diadenosine tetraphosphatase ApaH/serine/threonine PP2A family protein phosphatase
MRSTLRKFVARARCSTLAPALLAVFLSMQFAAPAALAQSSKNDTSGAGPDGPYVWREADGSFTAKRIVAGEAGAKVANSTIHAAEARIEVALAGLAKPLTVRLRAPAAPQATQIESAEPLFVLSDIEGNLEALLQLLRAGKVVDEELRWTFGAGHVVYVGDLFDRGLNVTECLWLFYELEARARAAGGEVHFLLGNHEVMNLTGDLRYVRRKYHENAELLGASLVELYSRETVLGQWLRTRNVALRIGGELFVHGGVSPTVAQAKVGLDELNRALREALLSDAGAKPNAKLPSLAAGSPDGLIWYRGYFRKPTLPESELENVLASFGVARVVVGHTVVENIGFQHGGRVLAVDVHHAGGTSQAALREKGKWMRLSSSGERTEL